MRPLRSRFRYASYFFTSTPPTSPWTRKEFYQTAQACHTLADELARHEQHRVRLKQCHTFNDWLLTLKGYEHLGPQLKELAPARPVARWQVMVIGVIFGLFAFLAFSPSLGQSWSSVLFYVYLFALLLLFFVPERFYGTTIELLEGKVLRVVETLEGMLLSDQMEFTEAVYFQIKDHLAAAKHELRQQIDLAHRP